MSGHLQHGAKANLTTYLCTGVHVALLAGVFLEELVKSRKGQVIPSEEDSL